MFIYSLVNIFSQAKAHQPLTPSERAFLRAIDNVLIFLVSTLWVILVPFITGSTLFSWHALILAVLPVVTQVGGMVVMKYGKAQNDNSVILTPGSPATGATVTPPGTSPAASPALAPAVSAAPAATTIPLVPVVSPVVPPTPVAPPAPATAVWEFNPGPPPPEAMSFDPASQPTGVVPIVPPLPPAAPPMPSVPSAAPPAAGAA